MVRVRRPWGALSERESRLLFAGERADAALVQLGWNRRARRRRLARVVRKPWCRAGRGRSDLRGQRVLARRAAAAAHGARDVARLRAHGPAGGLERGALADLAVRDDRLRVRAPAPALAACALLSSAGLTWATRCGTRP